MTSRRHLALVVALALPASRAAAQSYDDLAAGAVPVDERGLAGLLWSAIGECRKLADDVQRRQCRGVRAARAREVAGRTFLFRAGPGALWVGDDDAERGGVAFGLRGCLACDVPVELGTGEGDARFVVTRGSIMVSQGKLVGPDLTHGVKPFDDARAAAVWRATPGRVRGEILFRLGRIEPWSQDGLRGVFVEPVGYRVTDACDGTVLAADPPSAAGPVDAAACGGGKRGPSIAVDDEVPAQLSAAQIRETLKPAGEAVNVCFESYGVPGKAEVFLDVASDGHVKYAEVRGELADTPTSRCIVAALKKVQFPRFRRPSMQINYPFILR